MPFGIIEYLQSDDKGLLRNQFIEFYRCRDDKMRLEQLVRINKCLL